MLTFVDGSGTAAAAGAFWAARAARNSKKSRKSTIPSELLSPCSNSVPTLRFSVKIKKSAKSTDPLRSKSPMNAVGLSGKPSGELSDRVGRNMARSASLNSMPSTRPIGISSFSVAMIASTLRSARREGPTVVRGTGGPSQNVFGDVNLDDSALLICDGRVRHCRAFRFDVLTRHIRRD